MTLTLSNEEITVFGNKRIGLYDIAFDSSYPYGGETFDLNGTRLTDVEKIILSPVQGYDFEYDYTNDKIKVFKPAPPIVIEEIPTITAGTIYDTTTLKYPHAYIIYVGVDNLGYLVIDGALNPVTNSVAVTDAEWGVRPTLTFLATDAVDGKTVRVAYITQAWKEVFDNIVRTVMAAGVRIAGHADLVFTAGTPDTVDVGELAVAVQNVTWVDNTTVKPCKALYLGEDPATTEVAIDFSNATSSELRLSFKEEDTVDTALDEVYCTYIKKPASGFLADRFIEEDDLTPATDIITTSSGVASSNMLLFGACGGLPGATTKFMNLVRIGATLGVTTTIGKLTKWPGETNTVTLGSDHADTDHIKPSYVVGDISEIPGIVSLECPDTENLSHLTGVRAIVIGR